MLLRERMLFIGTHREVLLSATVYQTLVTGQRRSNQALFPHREITLMGRVVLEYRDDKSVSHGD